MMKMEWFLAELILSFGLLLMLLTKNRVSSAGNFYQRYATFLYVLALLASGYSFSVMSNTPIYDGVFVVDKLGFLSKFVVLSFGFFIVLFMKQTVKKVGLAELEAYFLLGVQSLGMMIAAICANWISLFVALELMYLPAYALVCLKAHDRNSQEAACKYVLMGAFSTGLMLYGVSFFYACIGNFEFYTWAGFFKNMSGQIFSSGWLSIDQAQFFLIIGSVLVLVSLCFKIGVVPFHLWVRDVYEGGLYFVVALIASVPKFILLVVWSRVFMPEVLATMQSVVFIIFGLGLISMFFGHLLALTQERIRVLLAYSSLAHMGFVLLALGLVSQFGNSVAMLYTLVYAFTIVSVFLILNCLQINGREMMLLDDLKGLSTSQPAVATFLFVALFSLLGLPPFAGFMFKMNLLSALVDKHYTVLAVLTIIPTVISAYYYINMIGLMYFQRADETLVVNCYVSRGQQSFLFFASVLLLAVGLFPEWLFSMMAGAF